jgi:hypothetical protein
VNLEIAKQICEQIIKDHMPNNLKSARHGFTKHPELLPFLQEQFGEGLKLTEYLYLSIHGYETKICELGEKQKFNTFFLGYRTCKQGCACDRKNKSVSITKTHNNTSAEEKQRRIKSRKETCMEKYGVENHMQLQEFKDKIKETNLKKFGAEYYSQTPEYIEKLKKISREKYGVDHYTQNDKVKEKNKETTVARYGGQMTQARQKAEEIYGGNVFGSEWFKQNVEQFYINSIGYTHPQKSQEVKDKVIETNIKKYGVSNPMKLDEIKQKVIDTNIERYGVDNPMKLDEYKNKIVATNLERYGTSHYSETQESKDKVKITNNLKFGFDYYAQTIEFKDSVKDTTIKKYGVENYTQTPEYLSKSFNTNMRKYGVSSHTQKHINPEHIKVLQDTELLKELISQKDVYTIAEDFNTSTSAIYRYVKKHGLKLPNKFRSRHETKFAKFLDENNINYVANTREILPDSRELDFYIPEKKLAIEICGLYWHVESKGKDKKYHWKKWNDCRNLGITLLTIFEDEFINNYEFWQNKLLYLCEDFNRKKIYARKCEIKQIKDMKIRNEFLNNYHVQGSANCSVVLGLYYEDELVSIMTFANPRSNKKTHIELNRFCCRSDLLVIGAAGKLLSYFIKNYASNYDKIISFSDNRYSNGDVYKKLNFVLEEDLSPDYKYVDDGFSDRKHKSGFKKLSIAKKFDIPLDVIDYAKEWQWMKGLGFDRIYDCGKKRWVMNI